MTTDRFGNKLHPSQPISMAHKAAASAIFLTLINLLPLSTLAQGMLPGCRLENGSLQCVPGLTADPEAQIKVLDKEISTDLEAEGHIEQSIQGLKKFILAGEARQGRLLRAEVDLEGDQFSSIDIHWYQRQGNGPWKLVPNSSEESFRISQTELGRKVMAILVVKTNNGEVKRVSSNIIGPIQ